MQSALNQEIARSVVDYTIESVINARQISQQANLTIHRRPNSRSGDL